MAAITIAIKQLIIPSGKLDGFKSLANVNRLKKLLAPKTYTLTLNKPANNPPAAAPANNPINGLLYLKPKPYRYGSPTPPKNEDINYPNVRACPF